MKKLGLLLLAAMLVTSAGKSYAHYGHNHGTGDLIGIYASGGLNWGFHNSNSYHSSLDDKTRVPLALVGPAINVLVGYEIMPSLLAVEGEFNFGLSQNQKNKDNSRDTVKKDYSSYSAFGNVVGKLEVAENNFVFAKLGLGYSAFTMVIPAQPAPTNKKLKESGSGDAVKAEETSQQPAARTDNTGEVNDPFENGSPKVTTKTGGFAMQVGLGYEFAINEHHSVSIGYNLKFVPKLCISGDTISKKVFKISKNKEDPNSPRELTVTSVMTNSILVSYKFTM